MRREGEIGGSYVSVEVAKSGFFKEKKRFLGVIDFLQEYFA